MNLSALPVLSDHKVFNDLQVFKASLDLLVLLEILDLNDYKVFNDFKVFKVSLELIEILELFDLRELSEIKVSNDLRERFDVQGLKETADFCYHEILQE
jgi:hypothetical protein